MTMPSEALFQLFGEVLEITKRGENFWIVKIGGMAPHYTRETGPTKKEKYWHALVNSEFVAQKIIAGQYAILHGKMSRRLDKRNQQWDTALTVETVTAFETTDPRSYQPPVSGPPKGWAPEREDQPPGMDDDDDIPF